MQYNDIRYEIMSNLNNPNDIINLCQIDKNYSEMCNSTQYWIQIFEKYNFKLPTINYSSAKEWSIAFRTQLKLHDMTLRMLNYINNNTRGITIDSNQTSFVWIISILASSQDVTVDISDILSEWDEFIFEKFNGNDNVVKCKISFVNKEYYILFYFKNCNIELGNISQNDIKNILNEMFYQGIVVNYRNRPLIF